MEDEIYERYIGKSISPKTVRKTRNGYLQAYDLRGKKVGKPFKRDGRIHKIAYQLFPKKFPQYRNYVATEDGSLRQENSINITSKFKKADWQNLGFETAKQGQEFVRAFKNAGMNIASTPSRLHKAVETFNSFRTDLQAKFVLSNRKKKLKSFFREGLSSSGN